MRVYMNTSALNRPFDDHSVERVRLEADAVVSIIAAIENHRIELASSEYLDFEVGQIPDPERALRVRALLSVAKSRVELSADVADRARTLERVGLRGLDALHVAAAEAAKANLLVTTDDRMIRRAARLGEDLPVRVVTPIEAISVIEEKRAAEGESQ